MPRKPLSKRTRFEVFKRDSFQCVHCGATPHESELHVDHLKPLAEGGLDDSSNLVTACADCNLGKGPVPIERVKLRKGKATEANLEHAEQLREWLAIQQEVTEAKDEVRDMLTAEWVKRVGSEPSSVGRRLQIALGEFGIERLREAMTIVGERMDHKSDNQQLRYFYGILRRWREEAAPPPPPKPAPAQRSPNAQRVHDYVMESLKRWGDKPMEFCWLAIQFAGSARGSEAEVLRYASAGSVFKVGEPFDVRGLRLCTERDKEGRVRVWVVDVPDFNPHEYAFDILHHLTETTGYSIINGPPPEPGPETFGPEVRTKIDGLLSDAYEISLWLRCYVAPGWLEAQVAAGRTLGLPEWWAL